MRNSTASLAHTRLSMGKIFLIFVTLLCTSCSNNNELENTGISFHIPEGYSLLSDQEIASEWLFVNKNMENYGNKKSGGAISMKLENFDISAVTLEEARASYKNYYNSMMPDIDWKESKVREINGVQWIYFELVFNSKDTNVLNIFLIRSYKQSAATFNYTITSKNKVFDTTEFEKFINSIKL